VVVGAVVVGADVSVAPIAVGFGAAIVLFAFGVPWLIRESRRPVRVPPPAPPREPDHTALSTLVICTRSLLVSILPRHTTPDATEAADAWRVAFAQGPRREYRPRAVPFANGSGTSDPGTSASGTSKGASVMPQAGWSKKRERQYQHVKQGLQQRGRSESVAEEIAARTVNKERARAGEARESSRSSTHDISSGRRGGLRSHTGPGGRTKQQLYNEARRKNIMGRSKMSKSQLQRAVDR
jgi:hypothetical protein